VLDSGHLAAGNECTRLEKELPAMIGQRYGIAVSSGTAGLFLALTALKLKTGQGVVIPSYCCTALLHAVRMAGCTPLIADVDPRTGNLDADTVKKALRCATGAVIVPHMFGYPADCKQIASLGVPVIEDCAQCIGATRDGQQAGSFSQLAVFSFYATKLIAAGEGGLVAASDKALIRTIHDYIHYDKNELLAPGFNLKLSDIHAAIARVQVQRMPSMLRHRNSIAATYTRYLKGLHLLQLPACEANVRPVFFRFVVRIASPARIIKAMEKHGIECARPVFKPLHRYLGLHGFSGTGSIHESALSLPVHPGVTRVQARRICDLLTDIC
jgi:perosamine synthetase